MATHVLSINLLTLYYRGAWYDPNQYIEVDEVEGLFVIAFVSMFFLIYYACNLLMDDEE